LLKVIQLLPDDPHSFAASSRLNWLPRRFKWTRPFRCKTKYGVCACAITFQTQNTSQRTLSLNSTNQSLHVEVRMDSPCLRVGKHVCGLQSQLGVGDVLKEIVHYKGNSTLYSYVRRQCMTYHTKGIL